MCRGDIPSCPISRVGLRLEGLCLWSNWPAPLIARPISLASVRSVFSDEKKLSIAALFQRLPAWLDPTEMTSSPEEKSLLSRCAFL